MRRGRGDGVRDEGAALILVLLFIMVVGIALAALVPYTEAGVNEARTARDVRSVQNAVDGAVQGAIGKARQTTDSCGTYDAPGYPDPVGGGTTAVSVTCADASGIPGNPVDVPPYAIVTTQGRVIVRNNVLTVSGGIYSTGDITTTGGSNAQAVVIGDAYSGTAVCGNVTVPLGNVKCPSTGIPPLPSVDYPTALADTTAAAPAAISAMKADPQGTCTSNSSIVTFVPGYYSQIPTVDSSCASNTSKIWWFSPGAGSGPGVYYFDFPDHSYDNYTDAGNSTNGTGYSWNLNTGSGITVVGGTLANGWTQSTAASVVAAADAGTRCDGTQRGVQFVLGGPTQITTGNNSEIELCGSATSTSSGQQIVLYGLSPTHTPAFGLASAAGPRTPNTTTFDATNASTPASDLDFKDPVTSAPNPDGARTAGDGNYGGASFNGSGQTYGAKLAQFPTPPDGSLIADAVIDVTHLETDTHLNPVLKITYASGATDTCSVSATGTSIPPLPTLPTFTVDHIDLMSNDCASKTLAKASIRWKELLSGAAATAAGMPSSFSVTYEVSGNRVADALVDGVQLKTTAIEPALEAERCNHDAATPCTPVAYSNSGSNATNNTYFFGTVYTPTADMVAVVHNSPNTIFHRGVIVSSLDATANSSSTQTDPPFQLPHSPAIARTLLFTATTGGRTRLQALVHIVDCTPAATCETNPNAPGNLVWPGRKVKVLEWTTFP